MTAHASPANRIGIEIEAALAFGTGHHGTTRGCLLLLDQVLTRRGSRGAFSISAPAPACWPSPRPKRCVGACWRATSTRARSGPRARQCAAERRRQSCRGDLRDRLFRAAVSARARRSIWCWRISSPIRCGGWRRPMARHLAPGGHGDPVRPAAAAKPRRDRGLSARRGWCWIQAGSGIDEVVTAC